MVFSPRGQHAGRDRSPTSTCVMSFYNESITERSDHYVEEIKTLHVSCKDQYSVVVDYFFSGLSRF